MIIVHTHTHTHTDIQCAREIIIEKGLLPLGCFRVMIRCRRRRTYTYNNIRLPAAAEHGKYNRGRATRRFGRKNKNVGIHDYIRII